MKPRSALMRILGAATAAGALAWAVMAGAPDSGAGSTGERAAAVADAAPGYAVEDYNYPNAEKILAEKNIVLKRGDGHIVLADCASETGLLEVWARSQEKICFKVTGTSGWLTLEIPSVYGIKGSVDQSAQVDMTVDGEEKSFDVPKNNYAAVGESADPEGREHILVEIRTAK
ncbi:hypothetical protein H9Y04_34480 [Streptomyces sp. TRM66268-LWL]|uniref:Secreted protein n=1 Tax=Streptomyces polyasparticus TaxID=2767826 RepID=A0ABR7SQ73_9ACTN|nr:hypothetical protein [Streptomyces polyasparticus]MBC9717651.1 hypothetical protein [Streptomyces polyasparticus]